MNKDDPLDGSLHEYTCEVLGQSLSAASIESLVSQAQSVVADRGRSSQNPYYVKLFRRGEARPLKEVRISCNKSGLGSRLVYSCQR